MQPPDHLKGPGFFIYKYQLFHNLLVNSPASYPTNFISAYLFRKTVEQRDTVKHVKTLYIINKQYVVYKLKLFSSF